MLSLRFVLLSLLFPHFVMGQLENDDDPRLRIDYWLKEHRQVTQLPECQEAQEIFEVLLAVADKPVDVRPKLYIFSDLPFGKVFALPDGAIILPLRVIKFCFESPVNGKARLAFILGHELKHVVHRDYWAIKQVLGFAPEVPREARKAIERQADEYGILYTALAGYDVRAIVSPRSNFLLAYYDSLGGGDYGEAAANSAESRLQAINRRLAGIVTHLDLFHFGVRLYVVGEYDAAIALLEKFAAQYPSREVFNNLGMCYYQKAFIHYAKWQERAADTDPHLVFRVSTQIDPVSRLRTKSVEQSSFQELIEQARKNFEEAKRQDETYAIALNNLGCAHLLKGEVDFARGYFKKVLELKSSDAASLNNLGVASMIEGEAGSAEEHFKKALRSDADYREPIYNLGRLYHQIGRINEATAHFKKYLQLDSTSLYAGVIHELLGKKPAVRAFASVVESIGGKIPGQLPEATRGYSNQFIIPAAEITILHDPAQDVDHFQYVARNSGEKTAMICAQNNHKGSSANGIRIGSPEKLLDEKYAFPYSVKIVGAGSWRIYERLNLAFEVRNQKVRAWYVYSSQ